MSKSGRRNRRQASTPTAELERNFQYLVVMRESSAHDRILMLGMIQQTLEKFVHLPGAKMLLDAGMDVYDHPSRYGGTIKRVGKSRMVLIEVEDVLYLYSMGSAAVSDDERDTNAFVSELVSLIENYRPREVCAVAFTRFVRSAHHTGDLLRVMTEHVEVVSCETEIRPATPEGSMLFGFLAIIAGLEREYIVRRHTAGRVAQWKRGEWIPRGIPPGYRVTKEGRRLVLDHSQIEATRAMLVILGQESLSVRSKVERLAEIGISTPKIREEHGANATIAEARNPSEAIRTLVGWVESLRLGRFDLVWTNPFPGVDNIAGAPVEMIDGYSHGALRLTYDLEIPDGGWADAATFEAIERSRRSATTGGAAHRTTAPLSGMFRFHEDGDEFALLCPGRHYELRRRPADPDRRFQGWTAENAESQQTVAVIDRDVLHRSITDIIVEALREGVPAELDYGRFSVSADLGPIDGNKAAMRALRTKIAQAEEDLRRAKRNAQFASDDDVALGFVQDCKGHQAELKRLRAELADAEAAAEAPQLEAEFESSAEMAVVALAALGEAERSVPREISEAIRAVISNEQLHVHREGVTWSLDLELPHEKGTVVLGPITGTVPNQYRPPRAPDPCGSASREGRRNALESLGLSTHAATVAAGCPHPDLLAALQAHHLGKPSPDNVDPAWVALVAATYVDPLRWDKSRWRFGDGDRQDIFDALAAAGGSMAVADLPAAGFDPEQLRYLMRRSPTPTGASVLRKEGRGPTARYTLLTCPHCDALLSRSCLTPETPGGLLCPTCFRTPAADSPTFPAWYLTLEAVGQDSEGGAQALSNESGRGGPGDLSTRGCRGRQTTAS